MNRLALITIVATALGGAARGQIPANTFDSATTITVAVGEDCSSFDYHDATGTGVPHAVIYGVDRLFFVRNDGDGAMSVEPRTISDPNYELLSGVWNGRLCALTQLDGDGKYNDCLAGGRHRTTLESAMLVYKDIDSSGGSQAWHPISGKHGMRAVLASSADRVGIGTKAVVVFDGSPLTQDSAGCGTFDAALGTYDEITADPCKDADLIDVDGDFDLDCVVLGVDRVDVFHNDGSHNLSSAVPIVDPSPADAVEIETIPQGELVSFRVGSRNIAQEVAWHFFMKTHGTNGLDPAHWASTTYDVPLTPSAACCGAPERLYVSPYERRISCTTADSNGNLFQYHGWCPATLSFIGFESDSAPVPHVRRMTYVLGWYSTSRDRNRRDLLVLGGAGHFSSTRCNTRAHTVSYWEGCGDVRIGTTGPWVVGDRVTLLGTGAEPFGKNLISVSLGSAPSPLFLDAPANLCGWTQNMSGLLRTFFVVANSSGHFRKDYFAPLEVANTRLHWQCASLKNGSGAWMNDIDISNSIMTVLNVHPGYADTN